MDNTNYNPRMTNELNLLIREYVNNNHRKDMIDYRRGIIMQRHLITRIVSTDLFDTYIYCKMTYMKMSKIVGVIEDMLSE